MSNPRRASKSDLEYVRNNTGYIPYHVMVKELNITSTILMHWTKAAFSADKQENRWQVMNKQLLQMEVDEAVEASIMNEYDDVTIRRSFNNATYIRKKRIYTLNRMFYMVTISNQFTYLVKFSEAVDMASVEFCPVSTGVDYEVKPVGYWEWMQLRDDLPVVDITATDDYIGSFWAAFDQMKTQYYQ